ncbi:MAG: energy transducer TonB [Pseudomonadota bacterium]
MVRVRQWLMVALMGALLAPGLCAAQGLSCGSGDACISALMSAARAGDHLGMLAIMRVLPRADLKAAVLPARRERPDKGKEAMPRGTVDDTLIALLNGPELFNPFMPEPPRVIAYAYLQANHPQEAAQTLYKAITGFPSYVPYWIDLATTLTRQGNTYGAVSALVIAHEFAASQDAMRASFEKGAANAPYQAMQPVYLEALKVIEKNGIALAQFDASLPPVYPGVRDEGVETPAAADFASCVKPEWRKLSLMYKETGPVTLHFYLDANGQLVRAKVAASSGYPDQDNAALIGISGCKFTPAIKDGKPVAAWTKLNYVWSLD